MRVLILTNKEHHLFVHKEAYQKYAKYIWIYINKVEEFPVDYDIGVSFMYQYKVPAKEVNSHPWFNFHPAPLPEYKGRNLCYHAIMNGEKEFGATLHYMDENFDTGDIIMVNAFPVDGRETAEDLSREAIVAAKNLFTWYFPRILAGEEFPRIPNIGGTYYKKEDIADTYMASFPLDRWIRAVTYKEFYPKLLVNGVTYKVVKE